MKYYKWNKQRVWEAAAGIVAVAVTVISTGITVDKVMNEEWVSALLHGACALVFGKVGFDHLRGKNGRRK